MNKIIKGKRYNTDTAQLMGEYSYSYRGDFGHWTEELYRKQTGEFFLFGEGGPASKYAESVGQNQWSGGERIRPLTMGEAKSWAEKYLDGDEYEKIFGEVEEDGGKKVMTYSLPMGAIDKLKRAAVNEGRSASGVLADLIEKYL